MFIVPINQLRTVMPSMGLGLDYRLILVEKVCGVLLCIKKFKSNLEIKELIFSSRLTSTLNFGAQ